MEFRLEVVTEGDLLWVVVTGELDPATAPEVAAALGEAPLTQAHRVVVDLTDCSFVDSTGIRSLIQLGDAARSQGLEVVIVCPPTAGARFTLDLLGLGEAFPLHDSSDTVGLASDDGQSRSV